MKDLEVEYFDYHSKNLTIKQYEIVQEIEQMLKEVLEKN